MWYLKKTIPEFSISDEARTILEDGLERKYPELTRGLKRRWFTTNKDIGDLFF